MLKQALLLCIALAIAVTAPGCSKKKTAAEMQAEKEQAWRAKQRTKAVEYYSEIVEKYPDSQYAGQAKERLGSLGGAPADAAKTAQK